MFDCGGRKFFCGKAGRGSGENMQLQSIAFSTTGYVRSTSPYRPHGVIIFPKPPKITKQNKTNKLTANQNHIVKSIWDVPAKKEHVFPSILLHPSLSNQVSKAPKSGSEESEPESLVVYVVVWSPLRQRCAECPSPVARRKRRNDNEFSGARMNSGD